MWNIATFNTFVAQDVLVFFYYIFALLMPILTWKLRFYVIRKFSFFQKIDSEVQDIYRELSLKQKLLTLATLITLFFCMELCLRMVFEAMIGYFDMHDYLYKISLELQKK